MVKNAYDLMIDYVENEQIRVCQIITDQKHPIYTRSNLVIMELADPDIVEKIKTVFREWSEDPQRLFRSILNE